LATASVPVRLELFGHLALSDPIFLVALPVLLIALVAGHRSSARPALLAPIELTQITRSVRQRLLFLPLLLQILGLVLVVVALARPVEVDVMNSVTSEGVDIVLAVDRSGSMEIPDLEAGRTRLEVVKEVVGDFAERRMTDTVGASDNVALLTFAAYPELRCPFTLDADALRGFLDDVSIVKHEAEDGTAIGAALAKAAAVLADSDAKSKVIVLLTDGENNRDEITPEAAIGMAKDERIKVYTILAARKVYGVDAFGRLVETGREPDTTLLEAIAKETGGRFFRGRDRTSLEGIYSAIEELERTPRHEERRVETRDLYPGFLAAAIGLFALARLLGALGLARDL
jgi:Ca-activated chloride channel family protein